MMKADDFTKDDDGRECDEKTEIYLQELMKEKHQLELNNYPHAARLLQEEIDSTMSSGRAKNINRCIDIYHGKPTKVVTKIEVPIKIFPKFNFVGKLLGPKGNTLKRLQEETSCRMTILGRGSMKDKSKEEDLRQSLDPKFSHLSDDLHIEVSALAPAAEAYARVAYALAELRKYFIPDHNDDIAMQQARELEQLENVNDDFDGDGGDDFDAPVRPSRGRGRGGMPGRIGRGGGAPSNPRGGMLRSGGGDFGERPVRGSFNAGTQRGRGAPRGRGLGNRTNNGGGGFPNPRDSFEGVQRRDGLFGAPRDDEGRGMWKPRGGTSRFSERNAPYSRRT